MLQAFSHGRHGATDRAGLLLPDQRAEPAAAAHACRVRAPSDSPYVRQQSSDPAARPGGDERVSGLPELRGELAARAAAVRTRRLVPAARPAGRGLLREMPGVQPSH